VHFDARQQPIVLWKDDDLPDPAVRLRATIRVTIPDAVLDDPAGEVENLTTASQSPMRREPQPDLRLFRPACRSRPHAIRAFPSSRTITGSTEKPPVVALAGMRYL
jgi:hypothetical protein